MGSGGMTLHVPSPNMHTDCLSAACHQSTLCNLSPILFAFFLYTSAQAYVINTKVALFIAIKTLVIGTHAMREVILFGAEGGGQEYHWIMSGCSSVLFPCQLEH